MKQRNKEDFLRNKHEQQLMLFSQETNQQYKTDLKKIQFNIYSESETVKASESD